MGRPDLSILTGGKELSTRICFWTVNKTLFLRLDLTDTGVNVQRVNASIFDSALSHTRRSDVSEKREENSVVALRSLLNVFACGLSSPRLYRLRVIFINLLNLLLEWQKFHDRLDQLDISQLFHQIFYA